MFGIIYITTNLINNKKYIGKHKCDSIEFDGYLGSGKILKNAIKKNGKELVVKRVKKNEFGEETEEYTDLCIIKGIYHEVNSYLQKNTKEGANYTQKKKPMVLSPYIDCSEVLSGDVIEISDKLFKVTEINNMGQEDIIADISLEVM